MGEDKAAPGPPAIEAQGLTKYFGHHRALKGVDLTVKRGEAVVIFGPNGAGKTTLIKMLSTIMNPSSGRVFVDGFSLKDDAEAVRRRIGVVTHQIMLYGNLTIAENLKFYSRLYDVPDAPARIGEVVSQVGMTARLHDQVDTLSRGMQQRVSIARALLHRPSVMLLDEPETGLDQQAIAVLWGALRAGGHTVILTTHNLERGLELGDRLLILNQGQIVYEGAARSLDLAGLKETYYRITG